jgi:hypothetical protein
MSMNFSGDLTLTDANTNYNLYTLMAAIRANVGRSFNYLKIIADTSNNGTNPVLKGDSTLTATIHSDKLFPDQIWERTSGKGCNDIPATQIYLRSASAAQKVHVEAILA